MKDNFKSIYMESIAVKIQPKWKVILMKLFNRKSYKKYINAMALKNLEYIKFNNGVQNMYINFLKDY